MFGKAQPKADVIVFGLGEVLGAELAATLAQQKQIVHLEPSALLGRSVELIERLRPRVVFCAADRYAGFIHALRNSVPHVPVVAVSRCPDASQWLDALEAGAADYCAPPFEPYHIEWILKGVTRSPRAGA